MNLLSVDVAARLSFDHVNGRIRLGHGERSRARSNSAGQYGHVRGADASERFEPPRETYSDAFPATLAKKPKLIHKNLEILEAEAQAVRVLEIAARR